MNIDNNEYIELNGLWIGPDGKSGIGTYSTKYDFVCGSVSSNYIFSTGGAWGFSASYVFLPRLISISSNTTYNPGTNSIVYIDKTNTSNLTLTLATPSVPGYTTTPSQMDGFVLHLRRIDSNTGYVDIRPSSQPATKILPRGTASAAIAVRLDLSTTYQLRLVYINQQWYEI